MALAHPSSDADLRVSVREILGFVQRLGQELGDAGAARQIETVAGLQRVAEKLLALVEAAGDDDGSDDTAPSSSVSSRFVAMNDNGDASDTTPPPPPSSEAVYAELESENRFLHTALARYVGDSLATSLLEAPDGLRLGGQRRRVTILMSDLRRFTSLTDGMAPEDMMRLLNNYLGEMATIIASHGGTIVEFIGDAIFALFGVPSTSDDDARRAVECAIEMQSAMRRVNARAAAEGLPSLEMGIALHTGDVVVGNIGSEVRTKYGAVGSAVNLASRIQGHAAGGRILISESTRRAARCEVRETFSVHAKGFADRVTVHELWSTPAERSFGEERECRSGGMSQ